MTARAAALLAGALALLIPGGLLLANGGTVRISRAPLGPYIVTVYSAPTPLRTGEVDVSVLVQDSTDRVLGDVDVRVKASPVGFEAPSYEGEATRGQATNKLFKAAKFDLDTPGEWRFEVWVETAGEGPDTLSFTAELTEATLLDRPFLLAALLLLPLVLIGALLARGEDDDAPDRRPGTS